VEISSSFPSLSLIVHWKERYRMNSSELEYETSLVHFKGIKGESE